MIKPPTAEGNVLQSLSCYRNPKSTVTNGQTRSDGQKDEVDSYYQPQENNTFNIQIGGYEIISKSIKYLTMTTYDKLSFKGHLDYSREKGATANSS